MSESKQLLCLSAAVSSFSQRRACSLQSRSTTQPALPQWGRSSPVPLDCYCHPNTALPHRPVLLGPLLQSCTVVVIFVETALYFSLVPVFFYLQHVDLSQMLCIRITFVVSCVPQSPWPLFIRKPVSHALGSPYHPEVCRPSPSHTARLLAHQSIIMWLQSQCQIHSMDHHHYCHEVYEQYLLLDIHCHHWHQCSGVVREHCLCDGQPGDNALTDCCVCLSRASPAVCLLDAMAHVSKTAPIAPGLFAFARQAEVLRVRHSLPAVG